MYLYGLSKTKRAIEEEFDAKFYQAGFESLYEVDGFSHPFMPIILDESPKIITGGSWGLLPNWAKSTGFQNSTLNADIKKIDINPSYQNYINKRCLVIASHYFLMVHSKTLTNPKKRILINLEDNDLFCFAGLYSIWKDSVCNSYKLTYTILTTEASDLILQIDETIKRMPIILKKEDYKLWLNEKDYIKFSHSYIINLCLTEI